MQNETGLEHYFVKRAADIVASKGKTMIGWDEIIDAGVSPDKAIVMWWRHDRKHQLVKALENGYNVIMTPRRPFYATLSSMANIRWAVCGTVIMRSKMSTVSRNLLFT